MSIKTVYQTSDKKIFETKKAASKHSRFLALQQRIIEIGFIGLWNSFTFRNQNARNHDSNPNKESLE
jgi:hypothetical protein